MEYPGYGPPGMMGGDPGMGQQGPMPGMYAPPPPGMFGTTIQAVSAYNPMEREAAMQSSGAMAGSAAAWGVSAVPNAMGNALMFGSMAAPMVAAGFAGGGMLSRGIGRGIGLAGELDPFNIAFRTGGAGMRGGFRAGTRMMGLGPAALGSGVSLARIGQLGSLMSGAFTRGGITGALGMGSRIGGAFAMGGAGAIAGAALPAAAGMALYGGLQWAGNRMYEGATDVMQGQTLMNQMGSTAAPGQNMAGQGAETGRMMREMSSDMGVGVEDIGRFAQQLSSQKVFQTTRTAKEFRDKFKEVMSAVKEIAQITQGSVDDAMKMFGELRQQGFYTTADIKSQAATRQAREATTGISAGVYSAIGGMGSQAARMHGMRGRFGADLAERQVAGVAMGVRSGKMSEEEVMEMGGAEAVGMAMAEKQMGFLGTSRGRAMIAYSMGKGGAPDPTRLGQMLGGISMEELVTGASGRGLGVLGQAGSRESKEAFAPYAGMAMISMAASQQQQLYGGISRAGTIRMMGTMGVGREEAELWMQQAAQMPQQLAAEQAAKQDAVERTRYEALRSKYSIRGRAGMAAEDVAGGLRGVGAGVYTEVATGWQTSLAALSGGRTYSGGDEDLARRFLARGGEGTGLGQGGREAWSPFGLPTGGRRLQREYSDVTKGGAKDFGMSEEQFQAALKSGEILDLGTSGATTLSQLYEGTSGIARRAAGGRDLGERKYARRSELEGVMTSYSAGLEKGATADQVTKLRSSMQRGDFMKRLHASRRGQMSQTFGTAAGLATAALYDVGIGDYTLSDIGGATELKEMERRHDVFFTAAEMGLLEKGATMQDFLSKKVEERAAIEGRVIAGLRESAARGDETSARMLSRIGERDQGLLGMRDIQTARDQFSAQLGKSMLTTFGQRGMFGDIGGVKASRQGNLVEKLTTDGKARASYESWMKAVLDDPKGADAVMYQDDLKKIFGADSSEYKAIVEQRSRLEGDRGFRSKVKEEWNKRGGMMDLFGERAYLEKIYSDSEGLRDRISGLDKTEIKDPALRRAVEKLGLSAQGTSTEARKAAGEALMMGILRSSGPGGIVSDEERRVLEAAGGAGAGSAVTRYVEGLSTGEKTVLEEFAGLKGEGSKQLFSKERLQKISSGGLSKEEQAAEIAKLFKEAGLTEAGLFGGEGTGTSTQGTQEAYVKANTEFVTAVHAFVSAVGPKVGMDVQGPLKSVTTAAGNVENQSGGNTS